MEMQVNVTPNANGELVYREGQAAPVFEYKGFQYTANSTSSLVALVISKSVEENCVIAYNETGFKAILNDKVIDRKQDTITYLYQKSLQYKEWQKILEGGMTFDQKGLIDFLKRREPHEVTGGADALIAALQNFKFVTNISGDFSFDDRNNYTFAFKIGDAEGTVRVPQTVDANIEVFNESGFFQEIEIEIEVKKPKGEGEKPLFALTCPKLARYIKTATEYEIERVKTELVEYLIVAGTI